MSAAFDFAATIKTVASFEPMKIITHHRGVARPALMRSRNVIVAIKKADPLAGLIHSREANQFCAEA